MRYVSHDSVEFEIPDVWLVQSGLIGASLADDHFVSDEAETVLDIPQVSSPVRGPGVRWFDEDRMLKILAAFVSNQSLPPVDVDQPSQGRFPYRVRDGLHRYYASVAAGFRGIPVRILAHYDINEGGR